MEKNFYRILIIEDNLDLVMMIKMILEHTGYTVFVLENTEHINELMTCNNIDVVVMDMFLAGANGTDICVELKKNTSFAHIPLIMMSAHPAAEGLCMSDGADAFISKPFELDEFLLKITHFAEKKYQTI